MRHTPVLLQPVIEGLNIKEGTIFVDCNLGDGGHSEAIIKRNGGDVTIIGIDLDPEALKRARTNIGFCIEGLYGTDRLKKQPVIHYCQNNFSHIGTIVREALDKPATAGSSVNAILFDLGLSSYELDESGRGFSFKNDDPLEMTFGQRESYNFTASDIVNSWSIEQIETIIRSYGEEKFAGRIARRIVEAREVKMQNGGKGFETARELAELIRSAYPSMLRFGRIHPATKTFQALRIAVNDELTALNEALPAAINLLKVGGRLAVISYHSLEDRIVKQYFKKEEGEEKLRIITKKPIVPDDEETKMNPRSRSAKLRIIEKL